LCDLCHQFHPLTDRVMGEQLTVCPACAQKQEIRHDPSARRKAELEREQLNTPSNAPSIFSDESNIVVDLLVGRSHWGGSHRHGLIDLLFRLLR
jgi:ribosome-binding protein aMBF1 (putative translation factor)